MKTADLIASLAQEARPVRRPPAPAVAAVVLTALSLLLAGAGAALMGWRGDLAQRLDDPRFWLVTALLLAICSAGQAILTLAAIPGHGGLQRRSWRRGAWAGAVLVVALAAAVMSRASWIEVSPWLRWWEVGAWCTVRAVLAGALPLALSLWLLRRGASVYPRLSGATLGLVCGVLGAFALQWSCDLSEPAHVMVWHLLLPGALLGCVGTWMGARWLRW